MWHGAFRGERAFLSNFYPAWVQVDGDEYPTVEHAFVACKSNDPEFRVKVQLAATPAQAKRLGRDVEIRPDWDDVKLECMLDLLRQKFVRKQFRGLLLATGDEELVEENTWHDQYWGKCVCPRHASQPGQNHLGKLLMQIRKELSK